MSRWGWILGAWCVPAIMETFQRFQMRAEEGEASLGAELLVAIAFWLPWVLVTPLVFALIRRFPMRAPGRLRALAAHAVASTLMAAVYVPWIAAADSLLRAVEPWSWELYSERISRSLVGGWLTVLFIYAALATVGVGLELRRHARLREREASRLAEHAARLEKRLALAQLAALRREIQPHFLFNTLHAISALIDEDGARARAMLARLSDLLRLTLDAGGKPMVALQEEIDLTERYLDIERIRLGERLRVDYEVAGDTLGAEVPSLLLQPLVENAVRHGIAPRAEPGRILIAARLADGDLRLVVRDDGMGLSPSGDVDCGEDGRSGIGLTNTRERLVQLYGERGRLEIHDRNGEDAEGHGVEVVVTLPFTEVPAHA